jgi:DnaK suppressor protein
VTKPSAKPATKAAAKAPAAKTTAQAAAKPAPKAAGAAAHAAVTARSAAARSTAAPGAAPALAEATAVPHGFAERFGPAKARPRSTPEPAAPRAATAPVDPKLANAWKHKPGRDLTEAELLAMPDTEYMNDKQLEFFRARLQAQKDDLLSNAGETTEHLREDTSIVPDPADRATIEEEHALELRTRDRERKLLKKISQALARLDSGDYGFCDETGEPIGLPRLLARPTATLSLEAQQRRELKQKMFGD